MSAAFSPPPKPPAPARIAVVAYLQTPERGSREAAATFLGRILPKRGVRGMALKRPAQEGLRNKFLGSNAEAADFSARGASTGLEVFHACATFKDGSSRKAANVAAVKCYWLDIDAGEGKPYADAEEAKAAVRAFAAEAGLPAPLIVASGKGVHAYWPLHAEIDRDCWREGAELLKAACEQLRLQVDRSRTTDAASILRPPGTVNRKPGREPAEVRLEDWGADTSDAEFKAALAGVVPQAVDRFLPGEIPSHIEAAAWPASNDDLARGVISSSLDLHRVAEASRALPVELLIGRDYWRTKLLCPLASAALDHPHHEAELKALFIEVSGQEGAFKYEGEHAAGFNKGAAADQWAQALGETQRRRNGGGSEAALGSLFAAARDIGWDAALAPVEPATPETAARLLADGADGFDVGRALVSSPPPPRRWLIENTLLAGHYTLLTAGGASGKTSLLLTLAVGAALGRREIAGAEVWQPRRVLFLCGEDSRDEILRRVWAQLRFWGVPPQALSGSLHVITGADRHVQLATEQPGRRPVPSDIGFRNLERELDRYEPDVLIVDPLVSFMGAGLNDNTCVSATMGRFSAILETRGIGAIIAHHVGKAAMRSGDTGSADAGLGAISLVNHARIALALNKLQPKDAAAVGVMPGEEWRHVYITGPKVNVAPQFADRHYSLESVHLPSGDCMQAAVPFKPNPGGLTLPTAALRAAVEHLAMGLNGTAPFSPSSRAGGRYCIAGLQVALTPHFPGAADAKLQGLAKIAFAQAQREGWVGTQPMQVPGTRNRKDCIVVRWSATPWASNPAPGKFVA